MFCPAFSKAGKMFPKGNGFILFASAKRTKKQLLGRTKSCQWQVFVRRRPPKQGELRTDVSKATMFQGVGKPCDPGSNRRSIRCFTEMTGFRQVTGYVRTAFLHSLDGNDLNRCELQALHKRICGFVQIHSGFFGKQ